jgi:hypothetical protein
MNAFVHPTGDLALSAVGPGPHHQPHPGLGAADTAVGWRLCRVVLGLGQRLGRDSPWSLPPPPWPWPPCSSRPAAASSRRCTVASTAVATTPPRRSPRSVIGCTSRSTWTACRPSCWGWSTRRCSRRRRRCGCGRPSQPPAQPAAHSAPVIIQTRPYSRLKQVSAQATSSCSAVMRDFDHGDRERARAGDVQRG